MSHPGGNDINQGSINNHPQHPYHITPLRPHPQAQPQPQLFQHGLHQPQYQHLGQVPPFDNNNNSGVNIHPHPPVFPVIPSQTRSTLHFNIPSYTGTSSGALVNRLPQEQDTSPTGATVPPHKLTWVSGHRDGLAEAEQSLTAGASSSQSAMRYIKGPLDVLNAEQYDDGRYSGRLAGPKQDTQVFSMGTSTSNPKKRGRKGSQNEQAESVEEVKRPRGRPRLGTGDHQDMKERRKEQIRIAQRAYRTRKETAITDLEAKVAGLEAGNAEVNAAFQSLVMEYVEKNAISARVPELGNRLQQFQTMLAQRCSGTVSSKDDEATSDVKTRAVRDDAQIDQSQPNNQSISGGPTEPATQQPRQLLGGIIVTHEPELQAVNRELVHNLDSCLENGSYTYVKMPNRENASFGFNLDFLDSSMQAQWSLPSWEPLPMLASGAFYERTFGRRLHRRTAEKAAKLLAMENPPYDIMHRVFGFVRNYSSLDSIRQRIKATLSRSADEDLDSYAQPFHHIGGSGTHFTGDAKTISYPGGAPFPNTGFGMGPFNERTTAVRDELLDDLQHTKFPGWQGEWFDSYEVEQYLAQKSITLPQEGDGYVEIPPGEFYDNPLGPTKDSPQGQVSRGGAASDFEVSSGTAEGMSMVSTEQTMPVNALYRSPVSSIDSVLSIPASTDLWAPGSMIPEFMPISQTATGPASTLLAYHNPSSGFPDAAQFGFSSPSMSLASGHSRNKRVWFSVEKFIESLGSRGTCVGRGPAFRKMDIVTAFWEAVKPGPE